ncbi:carbohydrate porin [Acinetobacter kookii]|nr:carbohydrate porin [Acinetobacter kookii]
MELNDSPNPTQWLMIRPNLQDVIHPGLTYNVNNVFVLG